MTLRSVEANDVASTLDRGARVNAPFQTLESKLRTPRVHASGVERTALIARLNASRATPIVVCCAGAGYGKTTTLAQWSSSTERPVAWISLDRHDNDPIVLLTYVTAALDTIAPVDPVLFEELAVSATETAVQTTLVPRLGAAFAHLDQPVVLVLDDVHAIVNPVCIDALVALAAHLAPGSQLVLSTRDPTALPLGLWRTRELATEFGSQELRMNAQEARRLLDATPAVFSDEDVKDLVLRTEGWPAGLYLAALSAQSSVGTRRRAGTFTGNDPLVADFLHSELIASLPEEHLRFLTRTSMLERLSGPLCDAALGTTGAAEMLESLEQSNRFVIALDRDRSWYRCHHLLRDLLAAELSRSEPELAQPLLRRSSSWCLANGQEAEGVGYAQEAGDVTAVAQAIERLAQTFFQSGRLATVSQWLAWLRDQPAPERFPAAAIIAALFCAVSGQAAECDRWAAIAELGGDRVAAPDGSASIASWKALLRAMRAQDGAEAMHTDAAFALGTLAPTSPWRPAAALLLGLARLLRGERQTADDHFADAAADARAFATTAVMPVEVPMALAERALLAIANERWVNAEELCERAVHALTHSRNEGAALHAVAYAVAARIAVHKQEPERANELLTQAQRRLPGLTYVCAVPAVQSRMEMAKSYLALADHAGARTVLDEVDEIMRRVADLGTLDEEAQALRALLGAPSNDNASASALTAAELRILPVMATHLSFPEIGGRLFLSRHTVKSHAVSIYRKLGVTSRTEAVERAREIGLL